MKKLLEIPRSTHLLFPRFDLKMRFSLILFFVTLFALQANTSYSQKARLTLKLDNVTINETIDEIERTTKFRFVYKTKDVDLDRRISVHVDNAKVRTVLKALFKETTTIFTVLDEQIFLTSPKVTQPPITVSAMVQEVLVEGIITNEEGVPLPGASVLEKGTTNGTQTDFDGNYTITVSSDDAILIISYLGYSSQEIPVNGQKVVNVVMQPDISSLDEVIIVGYGTQKKSDITGSVASVKMKELEELPITRVDQALQGRVPGVQIQNNDAAPNATTTVRIRGANSLNGGNDPLIVIDGFQGGSLNTLNPNDIQSIEVLKDASATAIYGSRGANGVVLVTTKRGKKSKLEITYNTFLSVHKIREKIDLLDAGQYAETVNAHRSEIGVGEVFTDAEVLDFKTNGGTDWQDEIYRNAFAQNHLLSFRGATENVSYYVSANVVDQDGIVKESSYNRYSVRSNIKADLTPKLSVDLNTYLSREVDHPTILNAKDEGLGGSPVFSALVFAPTKPVFNEDGSYSQPGGGYGPPANLNPLALALEPIRDNFINTTSFNSNVEYEIIDGLKLSVGGAYRLIDTEENQYINGKPSNSASTEIATILDKKFMTLQNTNLLSYETQIGDDHNLSITAVLEQQYEEYNENFSGSQGFLTDAVTYNNLALGANPLIPTSSRTTRSLLSYMGRINYGYKGRYLLTATARSDGSSVFGQNNKRGFFPSAALGWNISQEGFMEKVSSVSNLKLRASYGITGNQAIDPYQSLAQLKTTAYSIDGQTVTTGVVQSSEAANPDLKWERTAQLNLGVDLGLFNGRVNISGDYYKKNTEDLLIAVPLPSTSGVQSVLRNIGEVENKGIELFIDATLINKEFRWQTGLNYTSNDNEVLDLGGQNEITLGEPPLPNFGNTIYLQVGQPIGVIKGYEQSGVWKSSEATEAASFGSIPGAPKYVDRNNDGQIDGDDIDIIGNAQPDFTLGWNNTFSYKGFDLSVFVNAVYGNDLYNLGRVRTERTSEDADATDVRILNRWSPQNENTNVPSFTGSNSYEFLNSSRWMEDASFIRIQNITFGYTFPEDLMEKLKMTAARVYFNGTNLFTFTDYTGYDPEASTDIDSFGGIDLATYPSQKVFTLGIDLTF